MRSYVYIIAVRLMKGKQKWRTINILRTERMRCLSISVCKFTDAAHFAQIFFYHFLKIFHSNEQWNELKLTGLGLGNNIMLLDAW